MTPLRDPSDEYAATLAQLRALARSAARLSGAVVIAADGGVDPERKTSAGDVVTEADRRVERRIRDFLARSRPSDRVVGEELEDTGTGRSGIEWFVDPIDGTSNFVNGLDLFCTSVAAYDTTRERWAAGAVWVPERGVCYHAAAGHGAEKTTADGRTVRLRAGTRPGAPRLLGFGVAYDPEQRAQQMNEVRDRLVDYDGVRSLGTAAFALCLVADGTLASFVETDLFIYDWAAGALIAEEAGADILRPEGGRGRVEAHCR